MPSILNVDSTGAEAAALFQSEIAGKNIIITGASPGSIGLEAAVQIAKFSPGLLVLTGRSAKKLEEAEATVKAAAAGANVRSLIVDFMSLESVRKAAAEVLEYKENIDVLINSAGIMGNPYTVTKDGLESQFGVDHIAPFLFTGLIMPKLLAASAPRVVNVTSDGHHIGNVNFEDPGFNGGKDYNPWASYGAAKTANIQHAVELAKRYPSVVALSLHPGMIPTGIFQNLDSESIKVFHQMGVMDEQDNRTDTATHKWKTIETGATTYIAAAFDPEFKNHSGSTLRDSQLANEAAAKYALDAENAAKLWALSEKIVGQTFP